MKAENTPNTAVLISIRPEWCAKIFDGEKTMELRKTFPKDFAGQPFKCFVYCTKEKCLLRVPQHGEMFFLDGKVIGEFTCDRIYEVAPLNHAPDDLEKQACMDRDGIWEYLRGKGYAWHITDVKAYEKPLELDAFHLRCKDALHWCNNGGCAMFRQYPENGNCCGNLACQVNRPPQSWCYVEGPGERCGALQNQVQKTLNRLYPRNVSDILPQAEILTQLAEEHSEAAQAALKLRRAIDGTNPTPRTQEECWLNLEEEIGDVLNCIDALMGDDPQRISEFMDECREYAQPKKARWLERLKKREEHT